MTLVELKLFVVPQVDKKNTLSSLTGATLIKEIEPDFLLKLKKKYVKNLLSILDYIFCNSF